MLVGVKFPRGFVSWSTKQSLGLAVKPSEECRSLFRPPHSPALQPLRCTWQTRKDDEPLSAGQARHCTKHVILTKHSCPQFLCLLSFESFKLLLCSASRSCLYSVSTRCLSKPLPRSLVLAESYSSSPTMLKALAAKWPSTSTFLHKPRKAKFPC